MSPENTNNILDHPTRHNPPVAGETVRDHAKRPNYLLRRIGAGAALTATLAVGYSAAKASADFMQSDPDGQNVPTQTETVQPGDTLWNMTDTVKNVSDKREVINWTEEHSPDLADGTVDVADKVVLPVDAKDIE
jgi:hypothetical protein